LYEGKIMSKTTFSGPVRAGYSGGDASASSPVTPSTINSGTVISVDEGSGAYGFYSRVQPTTGFGSSAYQTPGEAYGVFGRSQTGAPFATTPSTTFNHIAGVAGNFAVIGSYANNGLMSGLLGIINTNTLSGDAAVMAFMQGDSGTTTCRAAFGVAMAQTTAASGFTYGLDLKMQDPIADGGGPSGVQAYKTAEIRLADDGAAAPVVIKVGNFTDGAASGVGKGSLGIDSTDGLLFVSDSAGNWQAVNV
jgi:hypothetical protein